MSKKKRVWQLHHVTYDPERTVRITKGEHFVMTRIQWLKSLSAGAVEALEYLIATLPRRDENE